jgi:transposase
LISGMVTTREDLPDDIDALKVALLAERTRAVRVEAELAVAKAKASDDQVVIVSTGTEVSAEVGG